MHNELGLVSSIKCGFPNAFMGFFCLPTDYTNFGSVSQSTFSEFLNAFSPISESVVKVCFFLLLLLLNV